MEEQQSPLDEQQSLLEEQQLPLENSVFVTSDRTTPLLEDFDAQEESCWDRLSDDFREDSGDPARTTELVLHELYTYYRSGGFARCLTERVGGLIILSWLVGFCVFLARCVDYAGLGAPVVPGRNATAAQPHVLLWDHVDWGALWRPGWFFGVCCVVYGAYLVWRLVRLGRLVRQMWRVRRFYEQYLGISAFALRTARWAHVTEALRRQPPRAFRTLGMCGLEARRLVAACARSHVAAHVTRKQDCFRELLERGLVDFVLVLPGGTEVSLLTRTLQLNLLYAVVNFFFDGSLRYRRVPAHARDERVGALRTRVALVLALNVLLLPWSVFFVALYAVFRYGEQFYKDPGSVGVRSWTLAAKWYFRAPAELPHVLDERLQIAGRYARVYLQQFATAPLDGFVRALAFVLGSVVVWWLALSVVHERALWLIEVSPGRTLVWWITVFSTGWMVCRLALSDRSVFYPDEALARVHQLVRRLPEDMVANAAHKRSVVHFRQLYPLRVYLLLVEFASLVLTPLVVLPRVYRAADRIVDAVAEMQARGDPTDTEDPVLASRHLVDYLQQYDELER